MAILLPLEKSPTISQIEALEKQKNNVMSNNPLYTTNQEVGEGLPVGRVFYRSEDVFSMTGFMRYRMIIVHKPDSWS